MNKKTNKLGYGFLSLALALALPLNASATENINKTEETTEPTSVIEETEDTKLLDEADIIDTETEESQELAPTPVPAANPSAPQTLPQAESHNYISQKGKENENKEKPFKVIVHDENNREGRLKKESDGVRNHFTLNYGLGIEGDGQEKEYTISVFALKTSKIESLNLKNYIMDSKAKSEEDLEKETEKIENDHYKGYKITTKLANNGSIELDYKFEEDAQAGDYSIYYIVEVDGEKILGKIDVNLEKTPENDYFFISKEEVVRDYAKAEEEKVNPFENLPFAKYLLNDTEEDKNLTDFINPKQAEEDKKVLKITYVDPASDEEKVQIIEKAEEYEIPANSLAKLEVTDKEEDLTTSPEDKKEGEEEPKTESPKEESDAPKSDETKEEESTDDSQYEGEDKELIDLTKILNKQAGEIEGLIKEVEKEADKEEAKEADKETDKEKSKDEVKEEAEPIVLKDTKLTEDGLKAAMANVDKLLEEKKRSVLELTPQYDETEAEIIGLSMMLREQTQIIEGLIQQALLDNELDSLEELEKKNPDQANEEYKRLAKLIKQAEDTTDKANEKLIELDEINQADLNTNPLIRAKKGEKVAVLNLGELTPITRIDDLTHDSPNESERDFSKNLEQKVARAVKKVETVTLTKDDDAKAKESPKTEDKKEDENKNVIVVDKDAKEADKKDDKGQKANKNLSLPIFERYLRRLKGRK